MLLIVFIAFVVHAGYWILVSRGIARSSDPVPAKHLPPMSVVVAARNEEGCLADLLAALGRQDHPNYEIVVVDDGSTDGTPHILETWQERLSSLVVIRIVAEGKKPALSQGIRAASNELLAFTDADCIPPPTWLSSLAAAHSAGGHTDVLVGYSPFRGKGSLVQWIARYETFITGLLTAGAAGIGKPYMAVGRNISYPRSVFDRVGGFDSIMHSMSGDDDLFVQAVREQKAARIRAVLDRRSVVPTRAPASWREWLRQKRRHASAGRFYRVDVQAHLAAFHASNLLTWLAPLFLGWPGVLILAARLAVQFIVMHAGARRLGEMELMPLQPLLEPLYLLYNVLVAPVALLKMPRRW